MTSFNKQITSYKTKHLEVEKKLDSLITKDYNFLLGRIYFPSTDGNVRNVPSTQNVLVQQPKFNVLQLKKIDKGTEYIIGWKSKGLYNSKLIALDGASLPTAKYFWGKLGMQFNNTPSVIEQINYVSKIVNVYIVYDLHNWPKKSAKKFYTKKLFVWCIVATEQHLMEKVSGVLVMTLLKML